MKIIPRKVGAPLLDLTTDLPWVGSGYSWHWREPDKHLAKRSNGETYTEYASPSYEGLIQSVGLEIVVQVKQDDYQGDTLMIVRYGSKYGVCTYSWGSCSGCDRLEGCNGEKDLNELRESIISDIQWFGSKRSALMYVQTRDWGVQPCYITNEELVGDFLKECEEKLG